MAIVRGASGFLSLAADLLPTGDYTFLMWVKRNSVANFSHLFEYKNTATNGVTLETRGGPLRVYDTQQFANSPSTSGSMTVDTWHPILGTRDGLTNTMTIDTDFESITSGGSSGAYQAPSSPELKIFGEVAESGAAPVGTKVGAFVIYQTSLDSTDIAHLVGGGDPTDLPSETAPYALWIDSAGVVKDGSDNLTTWTDEVNSLVLAPSGTVTVDDTDQAPVSYSAASGPTLSSAPATAYPGQSRTITGSGFGASRGTGGVTLGGVAQTVTAWSDTSITFTTVQGGLKFQTGLTLEATTDGSQTASDTMDLIAEPGTGGYVNVTDPAVADTSSLAYQFETAGGDPVATGDQCHWRYTGVSGDPTDLTASASTLITDLDQEGEVEVRFWDATDSTWGSFATVNAAVADETAPTFTSVDVPTAGSYKAGDALEFTANASETVTVTGTPQIPITIGGTTRQADYVSGTQALLFRYTVQAGDNDANGISVGSAISLNGGSIADSATNDANLTLNSIGDTSGVLVDTVKPVITPVGGSTVNVVVGNSYTDQGATASDDQDGSLGSVTGTGSVDTETAGQYTITYPGAGVVDSAGNEADDATRTVNVVAEDPWPYGKAIKHAATKNWTWGKRHPKTGMRTRMFK